ncbi:MAG: hydantoinase/oxoprolinase family protein, partial [Chitinophagia bacterium]|nr:hydantoinase/oxoprolinase family protein [Chitinophagia bacterium]
MKLGIDIGGTFTDLVLLDESAGSLRFGKTLTTYPDPTPGIVTGVEELMRLHNASLSQVKTLVHGTTWVTNAVIERKGARTALVTNQGFEDILEIGREMRYDIYDLLIDMPKPLVPRHLRLGVTGRIDRTGRVVEPLDEQGLEELARRLQKEQVASVAVCLLHSFANREHERRVGEFLQSRLPHLQVSLSCETMPEIREYERSSAVAMNAYVQPLTSRYLLDLERTLSGMGFQGIIHIMVSSGRLTTLEGAARTPIQLLESGPAGGTMAAVAISREAVMPDLLAFDMGGTTAKASLVRGHEPEITHHFEAARERRFKKGSGLPVRIPVIDMIEIGAGGGSIARVNALGLLTVGPDSASSVPGPACYGRGGTEPTVTDADLLLGFLDPDFFLGGTMRLDRAAAEAAMRTSIAEPLGISVEEAAWGIHRIVNENMANAARVHILEKGLDPRGFGMLAFGGAGPVHAFQVARLMHAPRLVIPAGAGVLSALGFLVSPVASEEIASHLCRIEVADWDHVNEMLAAMERKASAFVQASGLDASQLSVRRVADMRYSGQGHEINVRIPSGTLSPDSVPAILANFTEEYRLRYGRTISGIPVEAVTWRVLVSGPVPDHQARERRSQSGGHVLKGTRPVWFGVGWSQVPVYNRYAIPPGMELPGPCIIEETESTTVVGPESRLR